MSRPSEALVGLADALACPHCGAALEVRAGAAGCPSGHGFDLARQGYLNLLRVPAGTLSDTADMVAARDRFLTAGHYRALADAVATAAADVPAGTRLLEAGAGTGWYLAQVLDAAPDRAGLATDLSVPAVRRAARAHPRMAAIVADTWAGLPVRDAAFGVVLDIFAPRNLPEFARVLTAGGLLVVALPRTDHLQELRNELGLLDVAAGKRQRLLADAAPWFDEVGTTSVEQVLDLDAAAISDLVGMGPNAFHSPAEIGHGSRRVTLAVDVLTLRRRADGRPQSAN